MPILNPSFEIPGLDFGQAESWTEVYPAGAEDCVPFYDGSRSIPWENFEQQWSGNEGAQADFAAGDTVPVPFEGVSPHEDFETSWVGPWGGLNHYAQADFNPGDTTAVLFDALYAYEGFEGGWSNNEGSEADFAPGGGGAATAVLFDAALDGFEDFEEEWSNNENAEADFAPGGGGTVSTILFNGATLAYEGFEAGW
jgi:hypothetical protein